MQDQELATRVSNACDRCRQQKQRCSVTRPCRNCTNAGKECSTSEVSSIRKARPAKRRHLLSHTAPTNSDRETSIENDGSARRDRPSWRSEPSIVTELGNSDSAFDVTRRVLQYRSPEERATFAIPGGDLGSTPRSSEASIQICDLIGIELPAKAIVDRLLDVYFFTVHWFSLVVHEPTFRQRYESIVTFGRARPTDKPFLVLLLMVLVMSCQYGSEIVGAELQLTDLHGWRTRYLNTVRSNFMDLLDEDCIEFIQICILLGSHWLYWGKPRSSFTLLGTAIKSAQANLLHRQGKGQSMRLQRQNFEERKRVWWTIYTWDRFASIVYGRPLSINDKDCDVPMPKVFPERVDDPQSSETDNIELSIYQIHLNRIYQVASPMLDNVFSVRGGGGTSIMNMTQTAKSVDDAMKQWQADLPLGFDLDQLPDLQSGTFLKQRLHSLQALSLRLTYLNLKTIIHRSLLTDRRQRDRIETMSRRNSTIMEDTLRDAYNTSLDECRQAALAVSRLGQSKPNMILLAGKTHLSSFLAMNIFTSSVVLFICAMSDILSNTAQEAKRGMSRNLKTLKSMSETGSLSSQCSVIVTDLVQLILDKEREEIMLGPLNVVQPNDAPTQARQPMYDHLIAVPVQSHSLDPTVPESYAGHNLNQNVLFDDSANVFGKTMGQLHKVFKDASQARFVDSRTEPPANGDGVNRDFGQTQTSWQAPTLQDQEYPMGFDQDITQAWLWDLDLYENTASDWSGYDI